MIHLNLGVLLFKSRKHVNKETADFFCAHMKSRESRNTYMRLAVIHREIEKASKNRNKLIDKHTVMFLPTCVPFENPLEYAFNYLEKRYDTDRKKVSKF